MVWLLPVLVAVTVLAAIAVYGLIALIAIRRARCQDIPHVLQIIGRVLVRFLLRPVRDVPPTQTDAAPKNPTDGGPA
ncbi:hypothetical protein DMH18_14450 [Streptomyces sp. WAC 06783]|nr:hypothetical protein DMH18_14450 [Streptomyces sp. WAC 06783]